MPASENMTKLEGKERSVNFVEKVSSAKLETIENETCIRPRFASHTLSSMMKRRTPINPRKKSSSSMKSAKASKKLQKNVIYSRLSGIYKRRSVTKQSKSMQVLRTVLKREKRDHYRVSVSRQDSELTGTVCECAENSLVFLSSDLIKDVSRDMKKCAASPAKSMVFHSEPAKVDQPDVKRVEDSHAHLLEKMRHTDSYLSSCLQSNTEIRDDIKDRTIIDIAHQSQTSDEEKKFANSHRKVKVLHCKSRPSESGERLAVEDFSNENCFTFETQLNRQSVSMSVNNATTDRKYTFRRGNRKTWAIRKAETERYDVPTHVNVDRRYNVDLQSSRNSKFMRHVDNSRDKDDRSVVNCAASTRKKDTFQKNLVFINQRVWRPPGVTKSSIIKSATSSTQPTSQKSSRSTEKSIATTENKYSSIEHVEILNSESTSTSISVNQSKILMKENRDPRANGVTKICEHLAKAKQQQRLQSGGTLPKKGRSTTKVDSKTSNNNNEANPTSSRSRSRLKSKSRHWQTIIPRVPSRNWNEQSRTESVMIYNRRSRPSEVIHALKEIINGVKENEDVEDNAANVSNNDVFNNEKSDSELQALSNRDASAEISQNGEAHFIKNKHFDEPNQSFDQSFGKSINTQTEEGLDSTKILKLIHVTTQSSASCNNVVETGCNTLYHNAICKDAGISCDLIGLTNSKTNIDSTAIEDKTPILEDVPLHAKSITHAESNVEDEYPDKSKKLPISECKQTSSTEMTLKLEDYDIFEISAKMTNNCIGDEEKIMDENFQTVLKLPKTIDDKINIDIDTRQASTKYSSDSIDNLFSEKPSRPSSSIYDYDASCSSEELAEYLENDVQHGNMVMSELKVENIPSDLIAAFELAAERACNLHKAIIIYYENLIPGRTEKSDEETAEDYETVERCASFINCEIENRKKSECDAKPCRFHVTNGEDIDGFSTCSTRSGNSVQICEPAIHKLLLTDYCKLVNNKKKMKSSELLIGSMREEEYAYKVLQSKKDENDSGDFEAAEAIKTLTLPMTIEKTSSSISRENLLPLIYCILCSIVFWYLQVSFQCDPAT
ncbi:uncharacterized protein [Polyergus mexicanus]|uniref:uncharacterized protein n=1 Tax=Polyergus mexicanus TaxID=615972 RepID=UPI0038B6658D